MKLHFLYLLSFVLIVSCGNNKDEKGPAPESNLDATRSFLQAALEGKFDEARKYLLADSINTNFMDVVERAYANMDANSKENYRSASIRIHSVMPVNDSLSVIIFSNSYKNDQDTLKVLRINNRWMIDLKFLYLHDLDSLFKKDTNTAKPSMDTAR